MRIAFVLLAVISKGAFSLVYLVLAVVIPPANTREERAAAYGETFNAQELIDRAKKRATAEFKDGRGRLRDWSRGWRQQHRQWRRQFHQTMREQRWRVAPAVAPPAGYTARVAAGFMMPVLSLANAAFFWLCAYAVLSLVTSTAWLPSLS